MDFKDLLIKKGIALGDVLVLRHSPEEPELNKIIGWLASERPELFNAYQQTQKKSVENIMAKMSGSGYVASFIGHGPGKALFVGLYSIGGTKSLTRSEYWQKPEYEELKDFGMEGFSEEDPRSSILWFELSLTEFYSSWKGKLVIDWPPQDRNWYRHAEKDKNIFNVFSILEESALDAAMPEWDQIVLSWKQLEVLPSRWRSTLSQWRGIYYIFDSSDGKGYVGSAYGESNIYGRWVNYAKSGHGGNKLLKPRDPDSFHFSILQRVSPDLSSEDIIRLESTWKERLHTRVPFGLNEN
jgi:hypothetical protein